MIQSILFPFSRIPLKVKIFGIFGDENPKSDICIKQIPIPFQEQLFTVLEPPKKKLSILKDSFNLSYPLLQYIHVTESIGGRIKIGIK